MASLGVGSQKQPSRVSNARPKPSFVSKNDGITHEIYRGLSFGEFMPSIPSGSIDSIDLDTEIQDYAIALVNAPWDDDLELQFTTTFVSEGYGEIIKNWSLSTKNRGETVCGLFLVPSDVTSARTVRRMSAPKAGENPVDRESLD